MPNYLRNQDDQFSDPDLIQAKYLVGKNAYFEVSLALAELEDLDKSRSSSSSVSSQTTVSVVYGGGGGGFTRLCPEKNEPVWVNDGNQKPIPVPAIELLKDSKVWELYNPLTRNFNRLSKAELFSDVPLCFFQTEKGASSITSRSHKYIRNTQDLNGTYLPEAVPNAGEILIMDIHNFNIFQDYFWKIENWENGEVIEITLESEYIYATGHSLDYVTLAHNLKREAE